MHVDLDAFFTSVEQADNTKLKGKPVVVADGATNDILADKQLLTDHGLAPAEPV